MRKLRAFQKFATAAAVKKIFDQVCGKAAAGWESRASERNEQTFELVELRDSLWGRGVQKPEDAVRELQAKLAPKEKSAWTVADGRAAVDAALASLKAQENPVTIEVIPRDKHFTSLSRNALPGTEAMVGAIVNYPSETRVYIPLSELEDNPGEERIARHEFYHLLETKYLDPVLRDEVDAIHEQTIKEGKPVARHYGRARGEFFTTMGEIFEGCHVAEGQSLLRQYHPRLDQIFREATGRQP